MSDKETVSTSDRTKLDVYGFISGPKNHLVLSDEEQKNFVSLEVRADQAEILPELISNEDYQLDEPYIEILEQLGWQITDVCITKKLSDKVICELEVKNGRLKRTLKKEIKDILLWLYKNEVEIYILNKVLRQFASHKSAETKVSIQDVADDFKLTQKFLF